MVASDTASGLSDHGHQYAMVHAGGALASSAAIRELMSGMTQVGTLSLSHHILYIQL